ncbi:hypothetical protein BH11BAC2_BH11BAC2_25400 [soil metagenome]
MKRLLLLSAFYCLCAASCLAQENAPSLNPDFGVPPPPRETSLKDRLFFGGDLGLQFGDVTYINVAPIIGYKFTEKLAAGLGPSYSYLKDNRYKGYEYKTDTYGGRVFGQYKVIEQAMAYAEYEVLNAEVFDDFTYKLKRQNINSLLVGGGYLSPIGNNSTFNLLVLFNVIEDPYTYYTNPIIRAGVNIGF